MTETPWAERQLQSIRRFVRGDLNPREFIEELLTARHQGVAAREIVVGDLEDLLNDVWFALDMHNDVDDIPEPDEFDDAQLLEVVTGYLADWDAGTWQPDPRWEG